MPLISIDIHFYAKISLLQHLNVYAISIITHVLQSSYKLTIVLIIYDYYAGGIPLYKPLCTWKSLLGEIFPNFATCSH